MGKRLKKMLHTYIRDKSGQFAVHFALLALPLLGAISYALDYNTAVSEKSDIKNALDTAVLAATNNNALTPVQKEAFAIEFFKKNYAGKLDIALTPKADDQQVEMSANGTSPVTLADIIGLKGIDVAATSAALLTTSDVICVLALAPKLDRAIEFKDDAQFNAPSCSVQTNSTSSSALYSSVSSRPAAKSFCSAGGASGRFASVVKSQCTQIDDPYENLAAPSIPPGCGPDTIKGTGSLSPGNFCNGLKFDGAKIKLDPGVYNIIGELIFTSTSEISGTGVTFLLDGDTTKLKMDNSAKIDLTAPNTGETAGLVFWQKPSRKRGSVLAATEKSEISASASVRIVGTAYFPTQELIIASDNSIASQSPATSFIAYNIQFAGKSNTIVNVDHETGGIPPLLPRSDEGVRLIE